MGEKSWTYTEITESIERNIDRILSEGHGPHAHDWAYGMFAAWSDLTMGHTRDGDYTRLSGKAGLHVGMKS